MMKMTSHSIIREFHPGWFGAVMGTSILSVILAANPGGLLGLSALMALLAKIFYILAASFLLIFTGMMVVRIIRFPKNLSADLKNPAIEAAAATFPGGLLVFASATAQVGGFVLGEQIRLILLVCLGVAGVVLTGTIGLHFIYSLLTSGEIQYSQVNGSWFLPPVINIIIPLALLPLTSDFSISFARGVIVLSFAAWGIGFFLFLLMAGLLFTRMVLHPLPGAPFAPALWIGLGPVGVGSLSLIRLGQASILIFQDNSQAVLVGNVLNIFSTAFWGFGLFWFGMVLMLTIHYLTRGGIPFGIGWWAFTFPLGAFTMATLVLSRIWQAFWMEGLAVLLTVLLLVFWLVVTFRSIQGIRTGEIWLRK